MPKLQFEDYLLFFIAGLGAYVLIGIFFSKEYAWLGIFIALLLVLRKKRII